MSRKAKQTAKGMADEADREQLLIALYGADYSPQTREAFDDYLFLRTLFLAWDDRDAAHYKKRWGNRWKDRATLKAEIDDAKEQALGDLYCAIKSGDATYFRSLSVAIEADRLRKDGSATDPHRYWIVFLCKNPWSFPTEKKQPQRTAMEVKKFVDMMTHGDTDIAQIRRYCKELGVTLREAKRGRPKGSQNK